MKINRSCTSYYLVPYKQELGLEIHSLEYAKALLSTMQSLNLDSHKKLNVHGLEQAKYAKLSM